MPNMQYIVVEEYDDADTIYLWCWAYNSSAVDSSGHTHNKPKQHPINRNTIVSEIIQ